MECWEIKNGMLNRKQSTLGWSVRLGTQIGAQTKELYVICQHFDLILQKKKLDQVIRKSNIQFKMTFLMAAWKEWF